MADTEVLIVGAGPTGLVLALWLTRMGVKVRIIDKNDGPGTTSRALAVQARTLELYRQLDLADAVIERGHKIPGVNLWVRGERATRMDFAHVGADLTPYAFLQIFPQDEHEALLIDRLQSAGVTVERRTELVAYTDRGQHIEARIRAPNGAESLTEAAFIAGCDGAHSPVRETIGGGFPGGTYRQLFYVADVEAEGPAIDGELHVDLDEADFLAVFALAGKGHVRLIGTVRDERADRGAALRFEDVSARAIENLKVKVRTVNWFSNYHVHHRVTGHFVRGRAFVLGDAAHIHSPAGGQGMNTGIADAINLAWKLAAVLQGRAPDRILASYEIERIGFARRLVNTTDRIFTFVSAEGQIADLLRTRLAPLVIPAVTAFEPAREYLFRTVSQITMNYRDSPLSRGVAGKVHGGDRLPWAPADGTDNFEGLERIAWQVHVYGEARPELANWCEALGLALSAFAWRPEHAAAGLGRNAAYLMRPDSYVALALAEASPADMERYVADLGLRLT
jgi:2-polyprenyl-6-methoxyphenol hydroxylase-like FAD-dependent oxidoreductase